MIELRTLGTLSLRADDGEEIRTILVQPKRLALLAYLALKEPTGFQQRAALLPLFWPESDEARARLSLRSALHALRAALGNDVIVGRGDESVGLNEDRVRCDALELERALAEGRVEDALALYRGTLLEGLSIAELPAFDEWLDARRASLTQRLFDAAMTRARARERDGHTQEAIALVRRAAELMPYDETAIRGEMALLASRGDRAMAVAAFDRWAARLERELEVHPSPETTTLAAQLRSRDAAGSAAPEPATLGPAAVSSTVRSAEPLPRRRPRNVRTLAGVAAIVVVAAAMTPFWMRVRRAQPELEPRTPSARAEFARAEQLEAAGEYAAALETYRRVSADEPDFARAYYGMSIAAQWAGRTDSALVYARRAAGMLDQLPAMERASLPAWRAFLDARIGDAADLYAAALKRYPDDARSWMQLGELRFHWGSAFGVPSASAADAFRQALRLQPTNGAAIVHLARLTGRSGQTAAFDSLALLADSRALSTTERLELHAFRAVLHDNAAGRVQLLGETIATGASAVVELARLIAPVDSALTRSLAHALTSASNRIETRALGYVVLAHLEIARGRVSAARAWLDSLGVDLPAPGAEQLGAVATLPWMTADTALARVALAAIDHAPRQQQYVPLLRGEAGMRSNEIRTARRLYLTALLRAQLGDTAAAERDAEQLETPPKSDSIERDNARELASTVRAIWAFDRGDAARALALIGEPGTQLDASIGDFTAYPKARRRYLRAQALERLGRPLDAVAWYSTFPDPSSYDIAYVGPAMLGAARGYARLGNPTLADSLTRVARGRWSAR